jgi:hypothetical protein
MIGNNNLVCAATTREARAVLFPFDDSECRVVPLQLFRMPRRKQWRHSITSSARANRLGGQHEAERFCRLQKVSRSLKVFDPACYVARESGAN